MHVPELVPTGPRPTKAPSAGAETEPRPGANHAQTASRGGVGDFESLLAAETGERIPEGAIPDTVAPAPPAPPGAPPPEVAEAVPEAEAEAAAAEGEPLTEEMPAPVAAPAAAPVVPPPVRSGAPDRQSDGKVATTAAAPEEPDGAAPVARDPAATPTPVQPVAERIEAIGARPQVSAPQAAEFLSGDGGHRDRAPLTTDAVEPGPPATPGQPAGAASATEPRAAHPAVPTVPAVAPSAAAPEAVAAAAGQGGAEWRLAAEAAPQAARATAEVPQALPVVPPQVLADQITLAVGRARERWVQIRLDPPELGRVQIQLTPTETGLQALVLAERPETHELLRRHAELLARDLAAAGFRDVTLDFATGGQASPGRDEARPVAVADAPVNAAAPEPAAPLAARRAVAGGLDIRL